MASSPVVPISVHRTLLHAGWLIITLLLAAFVVIACGEEPRPPLTALTPDVRTRFHVTDQLGSTVIVTNVDGDVIARDAPTPYGERWFAWREGQESGPRYRYVDNEDDPIAGSIAMGTRQYLPPLGRWASPDPLFVSKPEVLLERPAERNLYRYAAHDPIRNTDPSGTSWWSKALKVGRALVRGGSAIESFKGNIKDATTLLNPNASASSRVIAGLSLASEIAPVSVDDLRSLRRLASGTESAATAVKQAAGSVQAASAGARRQARVGRWMSGDEYKKMERTVSSRRADPARHTSPDRRPRAPTRNKPSPGACTWSSTYPSSP